MAGHPTVSGLPDYAKTPEGYARFAAETSAGSTFATTIALLIVTTIVVGLRLLSRRIARLGFWWDDYITVLAWAMAVVVSMEGIVLPLLGLGHHTVTILPLLEREQRTRYFLAIFYLPQLGVVKFGVLLMYARIFPVAPLRFGIRKMNGYSIAWYIVFAVITGYTISFTIVGIRPCAPIPGLWIRPPPKLTCIKSYTAYIAAGINIFNDMLILSLPVHNILKLRLLPVQKVYLCGIFLLGGFVVLTSVVRIWAQTRSLDKSDSNYDLVPAYLWTMIEVLTGVICSCLPVLGPVLDRMLGKNHTLWTPKSSRKSSPNSTNVDHPGQGALTKQISPSSSEGRLGVGTKSSGTTLRSDEEKLDLEAGIPSAMAEMPTGGSTMPTLPRQTYQRSSPAAAPTTNAFPSTTVSPTSDSPTARPGHGSSESGHNINRDVALTGGYRDQFSEPPYKGAGREGGGEWGEGAEGHRNQLADLRKQRLRMDESVEKKFVGGGVAL